MMSCVEMGGDVGRGLLVAKLEGGLFSCRGEEGEIGEERVDQVIY
jgi:hypothetical protein